MMKKINEFQLNGGMLAPRLQQLSKRTLISSQRMTILRKSINALTKPLTLFTMLLVSVLHTNAFAEPIIISSAMGSDNVATWWTPIAHYNGNIYMVYIDNTTNCKIAKWTGSSTSWSIVDTGIVNDPGHTQASVAIDGNGYIHVVYGMHSDSMKYKRSAYPENISSFLDKSSEFPSGYYTYPCLTSAPNGDIYLLIREGLSDHTRPARLFRWDNGAKIWSTIGNIAFQDYYVCYPDSIYADANGIIHMTYEWSYMSASGIRHFGSYLKYDHPNGSFYKADGSQVIAPVSFATDDVFQPKDNPETWENDSAPFGMQGSVVRLDNGNPVIYYSYSMDGSPDDFNYRFARWTGLQWVYSKIADTNVVNQKGWMTSSEGLIRYYYIKTNGDLYVNKSWDSGTTFIEELLISGKNLTRMSGVSVRDTDYLYLASPSDNKLYLDVRSCGDYYEAEYLTYASTDSVSVIDDVLANESKYLKLNSNAVNDYIELTLNVPVAGTYNIYARTKKYNNRGKAQLYIDGIAQGGEWDQYAPGTVWEEELLGTKNFLTTGNKAFKFKVAGINVASTGYSLTIDSVRCQLAPPASFLSYETEDLAYASTGSVSVIDDAFAIGNKYLKLNSNAVNDYIELTLNVPVAGTYNIYVRTKKYNNRAKVKLYIDEVEQSGVEWDQYEPYMDWEVKFLGTKTFATTGNKAFKFKVTGKNDASTTYSLAIDRIYMY